MHDRDLTKGNQRTMGQSDRRFAEKVSDDVIQAVSNRLAERKSVFDQHPNPPVIALPGLLESLGNAGKQWKDASSQRSQWEDSSVQLDPSLIKLPEEKPADGSKPLDQIEGARGASEGPASHQITPQINASEGVYPDVSQVRPGSAQSARASSNEGLSLDVRNASMGSTMSSSANTAVEGTNVTSNRLETRGDPGRPMVFQEANPRFLRLSAAVERCSTPVQGAGTESPASLTKADSTIKVATGLTTDPHQDRPSVEKESDPRIFSGIRGSTAGFGDKGSMAAFSSSASKQFESSMGFVKTPDSSDLKGLSLSSPASSTGGITFPKPAMAGSISEENPPGGSGSSQGGTPVDLSKTNELLQQLLDAVRKQRSSSLPTGGPSVYPDR